MTTEPVWDAAARAEKVDTDAPHGWIQWKGTDACVDLHCACGTLGHFDGYFGYQFRCKDCDRHYGIGQNVVLAEMTDEEVAEARRRYPEIVFHEFSDDD